MIDVTCLSLIGFLALILVTLSILAAMLAAVMLFKFLVILATIGAVVLISRKILVKR